MVEVLVFGSSLEVLIHWQILAMIISFLDGACRISIGSIFPIIDHALFIQVLI